MQINCRKCRAPFSTPVLQEPNGVAVRIYCPQCLAARHEVEQRARQEALKRVDDPERVDSIVRSLLRSKGWQQRTAWVRQTLDKAGAVNYSAPECTLSDGELLRMLERGEGRYTSTELQGRRSRRVTQKLLDLLSHPDPHVRYEVICALSVRESARTALCAIVDDLDEHPTVRAVALDHVTDKSLRDADQRLGWVRRMMDMVQRCLADPAAEVRWWACWAASHTGNRRYLPALERLLADDAIGGIGWTVGEEAADAIDTIEGRDPPDREPRVFDRWKDPWHGRP